MHLHNCLSTIWTSWCRPSHGQCFYLNITVLMSVLYVGFLSCLQNRLPSIVPWRTHKVNWIQLDSGFRSYYESWTKTNLFFHNPPKVITYQGQSFKTFKTYRENWLILCIVVKRYQNPLTMINMCLSSSWGVLGSVLSLPRAHRQKQLTSLSPSACSLWEVESQAANGCGTDEQYRRSCVMYWPIKVGAGETALCSCGGGFTKSVLRGTKVRERPAMPQPRKEREEIWPLLTPVYSRPTASRMNQNQNEIKMACLC